MIKEINLCALCLKKNVESPESHLLPKFAITRDQRNELQKIPKNGKVHPAKQDKDHIVCTSCEMLSNSWDTHAAKYFSPERQKPRFFIIYPDIKNVMSIEANKSILKKFIIWTIFKYIVAPEYQHSFNKIPEKHIEYFRKHLLSTDEGSEDLEYYSFFGYDEEYFGADENININIAPYIDKIGSDRLIQFSIGGITFYQFLGSHIPSNARVLSRFEKSINSKNNPEKILIFPTGNISKQALLLVKETEMSESTKRRFNKS